MKKKETRKGWGTRRHREDEEEGDKEEWGTRRHRENEEEGDKEAWGTRRHRENEEEGDKETMRTDKRKRSWGRIRERDHEEDEERMKIRKAKRTKSQREHREGTGDEEIRRKKDTSCVFWGKNARIVISYCRVVKCPHHTENMEEKETKSVTVKRDKESRRKKNMEKAWGKVQVQSL
jgi:hypothetical protein